MPDILPVLDPLVDPVTEYTGEPVRTPLGLTVTEAVCELKEPVGRPVEVEARLPDTVPEGERELLIVPVPVLDSLGLPDIVRTTDFVLDGEGEPVIVLPLKVIVSDLLTLWLAVVEGLTVDVVLPDPLTLEDPLADPESLGLL